MSMLKKVKMGAFGVLGAVMFFAAGNNVFAIGTPHGETPAEEIVCDGLSGPSFGLCNAYCEAMDCDSDFPAASQSACDKVAGNFAKHSDGAPLPCEKVECPCVRYGFWDGLETRTNFCREQYGGVNPGTAQFRCNINTNTVPRCSASNGAGGQAPNYLLSFNSSTTSTYLDFCSSFVDGVINFITPISLDESQACADVLDAYCVDPNLP